MALCFICAILFSCVSKEQKIATEYLKSTMKSPSSFKVISVEKENIPASISYDTTYHIKKICKHSYYMVDSVLFDSIKIWRTEYPQHQKFFIKYDTANTYGGIMREAEEVCVVNGEPFLWKEFIINEAYKKFDHIEAYKKTIYHDILFAVDNEEWIYSFQLGEEDILSIEDAYN